jgi:hypothetical protein
VYLGSRYPLAYESTPVLFALMKQTFRLEVVAPVVNEWYHAAELEDASFPDALLRLDRSERGARAPRRRSECPPAKKRRPAPSRREGRRPPRIAKAGKNPSANAAETCRGGESARDLRRPADGGTESQGGGDPPEYELRDPGEALCDPTDATHVRLELHRVCRLYRSRAIAVPRVITTNR